MYSLLHHQRVLRTNDNVANSWKTYNVNGLMTETYEAEDKTDNKAEGMSTDVRSIAGMQQRTAEQRCEEKTNYLAYQKVCLK